MPECLLIPEDGIVDEIAVETAAAGLRKVTLTRTERLVATALILAAGHGYRTVCARLGVTDHTALALVHQVSPWRGPLPPGIARRCRIAAIAPEALAGPVTAAAS